MDRQPAVILARCGLCPSVALGLVLLCRLRSKRHILRKFNYMGHLLVKRWHTSVTPLTVFNSNETFGSKEQIWHLLLKSHIALIQLLNRKFTFPANNQRPCRHRRMSDVSVINDNNTSLNESFKLVNHIYIYIQLQFASGFVIAYSKIKNCRYLVVS